MANSDTSKKVSQQRNDAGDRALQNVCMSKRRGLKTKTSWYLRQWRKHRGYTQERLGEMVGLSKPYISQLETGERQYTQELLETLAEALRCSPPDLIMRDPSDPDGIWSIWDALQPVERRQVVEIAKTIKKTGTDD